MHRNKNHSLFVEKNIIFADRLVEYKYYNMDQVIAEALKKCEQVI